MRIFNLKTRLSLPVFLVGIMCMMISCDSSDDSDLVLDRSVELETFSLLGTEGEIDQAAGEVSFNLPYNSDVSGITPTVSLPKGALMEPSPDTPANFGQEVGYTVLNGNLYKDYTVKVDVEDPILGFSINGREAAINHTNRNISLILPEDTDLSALQPEIELSSGLSIQPSSGSTVDFSEPVTFTVTANDHNLEYTATVTTPTSGMKVAFLGVAANRGEIGDPDEKAASDWLFSTFGEVAYLSFEDIAAGTDLSGYSVIWWHYDSSMDLPDIAFGNEVVTSLKDYRAAGGNLLLSTYAAQYVEALGVVPSGHGPNNVFGDFPPNGFVENDNDWGISFRGQEEHPIYEGLETFEEGKAYFLEKGTFRLNHTAWWFLPEWGGYDNGAGWREQTGGINLASEAWDDHLDGRVAIAEFPGNASAGTVVVFGFGAYDWYIEADADGNPSAPNGFLSNIEQLTSNAINYMAGEE